VKSLALDVVIWVTGARAPLPLSWAKSRRSSVDGLPLAVHRPAWSNESGTGVGETVSEPHPAARRSNRENPV
jgi:hypothetical protein